MANADLGNIPPEKTSAARWVAALLHGIGREEAFARRPARVTEPRRSTWARFRGRLSSTDLVSLLFEDAAVTHEIPFALGKSFPELSVEGLPETLTEGWLDGLFELDLKASAASYLETQARLLGLTTKLARSELHVVKPHHRVLELPGTGGQLAHHVLSTNAGLALQSNVVVCGGSWAELTLAGLIGLEQVAPSSDFIVAASKEELREPQHPLRQRSFDFVIGLQPEKGGQFAIPDELAIWFPTAKILLV